MEVHSNYVADTFNFLIIVSTMLMEYKLY